MADSIENYELITDAQDNYEFWSKYEDVATKIRNGLLPQIIKIDLSIDTSTENTLTDTIKPNNVCKDFATPKQVYLRSDAAGDKSKNIDVIGQKADGSFGQFTLTSDDTDGTTAVDVGKWMFISCVIKNDDWAGNAILDDDGLSGTVYFSQALGVSSDDGILVVPDGKKGLLVDGYAHLLSASNSAEAMNLIEIGDDWSGVLSDYHVKDEKQNFRNLDLEQTQIDLKTAFTSAVTAFKIHLLYVIW
jgi:hypothetical protein